MMPFECMGTFLDMGIYDGMVRRDACEVRRSAALQPHSLCMPEVVAKPVEDILNL